MKINLAAKTVLAERIFMFRLIFCNRFYNFLCSWPLIVETLFDPLLKLFSKSFKYLGPIFIFFFIVLTTSMIVTFYTCLLPMRWKESPTWACIHFLAGHWILWNIFFNYVRASFTSPGYTDENILASTKICKKCILPKPQRSHHCSVCKKCILKMDHHCPWINNCVGHHNHRYFFLFSAYMFVGCVYVSAVAYPLFKRHIRPFKARGLFAMAFHQSSTNATSSEAYNNLPEDHLFPAYENHFLIRHSITLHGFVASEFLMCMTAALALFGLLVWHSFLISRGETSIEVHTNKRLKSLANFHGKPFDNPHDHGLLNNWKNFLGLVNGKSLWRHILFPSSHPAVGDGIHWNIRQAHGSFEV